MRQGALPGPRSRAARPEKAPRTAHRLASGIEDAGFQLRDQLVWLYGNGVPKSGLRNGRGSALTPGYEPIVLARKPLAATRAPSGASR